MYPLPVVMVTCLDQVDERPNIITVAWTGIANSDPAMLYISVRRERFSHRLIAETGQFVVNLPTKELARVTDLCGVKSGADVDKFALTGLTPQPATKVKPPVIAECPINIECEVRNVLPLGSHDMFLGEIVAVDVDERLIDDKGRMDIAKAGLIAYVHGQYWDLGKSLGKFGFSVQKKRRPRR